MRVEEKKLSGSASRKQSLSFVEWCLFLQDKTGSRQCWNQRYKPIWNRFIEEHSVEVMIGLLTRRDFTKVEYAIEMMNSIKEHEYRLLIEAVGRERYWEMRKPGMMNDLDVGAEVTGVKEKWSKPRKPKYSHVNKLIKIQAKHGLRSPQATKYARKWGMAITRPDKEAEDET